MWHKKAIYYFATKNMLGWWNFFNLLISLVNEWKSLKSFRHLSCHTSIYNSKIIYLNQSIKMDWLQSVDSLAGGECIQVQNLLWIQNCDFVKIRY